VIRVTVAPQNRSSGEGVHCSDRVQLGDGVGRQGQAAPATFSRKRPTGEVPGISMMFGESFSSQDRATAAAAPCGAAAWVSGPRRNNIHE
jgi:hypothetical protein